MGSLRPSAGNRTTRGGDEGRDIVGRVLKAVRAAEEEDVERVDSVRVRSGFPHPPTNRDEAGAGSVVTECREDTEFFLDSIRSWLDDDTAVGESLNEPDI